MKIRKFYPLQVLRNLRGKILMADNLNLAIVRYANRIGYELSVAVVDNGSLTTDYIVVRHK